MNGTVMKTLYTGALKISYFTSTHPSQLTRTVFLQLVLNIFQMKYCEDFTEETGIKVYYFQLMKALTKVRTLS